MRISKNYEDLAYSSRRLQRYKKFIAGKNTLGVALVLFLDWSKV